MGLGVVARDEQGKVISSARRQVRAWWAVVVMEGKALCLAVRMARLHNHSHVTFEMHCQSLVSRLSKETIFFSDLDSFSLCNSFEVVAWCHVCKDGNSLPIT